MAISQPLGTDKLNSPSHSLSHRVFSNDSSAPVNSVVVDSTGKVGFGTETPTSTMHNTGSFTGAYRAITALRTLDDTDYIIDCTANSFTITLPSASSIAGRTYVIKNSGTGSIVIACSGAETIDGVSNMTLSITNVSISVVSTGTNWIII